MGFMGLGHWVESDNAAGFRWSLIRRLMDETKKELKDKANEYNTPGFINVAFMIEEGTYDFIQEYEIQEDYADVFLDCYKQFCEHEPGWEEDTDLFIDYERLKNSVKKFLEKNKVEV